MRKMLIQIFLVSSAVFTATCTAPQEEEAPFSLTQSDVSDPVDKLVNTAEEMVRVDRRYTPSTMKDAADEVRKIKLLMPIDVRKDAEGKSPSPFGDDNGPCSPARPHYSGQEDDPCIVGEDRRLARLRKAAAEAGSSGLEELEPRGFVSMHTWKLPPSALPRKYIRGKTSSV